MTDFTWAYHCSRCDQIVEVEDVAEHVAAHRAERDWDGKLSFERVNNPPEREAA